MTRPTYHEFRRKRAERHYREEQEALKNVQIEPEFDQEWADTEQFLPRKQGEDDKSAETFATKSDEK